MSFEKLIILIILFNVATGILAKRKKNKAEKAKASGVPENRARTSVETAAGPSVPTPAGKPTHPPAGRSRDLFKELAKELGLEIPEAEPSREIKPEPQISPAPAPPSPVQFPRRPVERYSGDSRTATEHTRSADETQMRVPRKTSGPRPSLSGISAKNTPDAYAPVLPTARSREDVALLQNLYDPSALERSFVLKTILDPPVSMRQVHTK